MSKWYCNGCKDYTIIVDSTGLPINDSYVIIYSDGTYESSDPSISTVNYDVYPKVININEGMEILLRDPPMFTYAIVYERGTVKFYKLLGDSPDVPIISKPYNVVRDKERYIMDILFVDPTVLNITFSE